MGNVSGSDDCTIESNSGKNQSYCRFYGNSRKLESQINIVQTGIIMNITWAHHKGNTHNAFFGNPKNSNYAAYVHPYDGGFLWEIRHRCRCCNKITLCRKGSSKRIEPAMKSVKVYMLQLLHLFKIGHK